MKLAYISPSTIPSRAANAVHVVMQCDALVRQGVEVVLFARRTEQDETTLPKLLEASYGTALPGCRIVSFFTPQDRATSLRIAIMALVVIVTGEERPDAILSRNLYASFLLGVLARRPLLFETHQLERGWRKYLQRVIMTRPWVKTIVISEKLLLWLQKHHGTAPSCPIVLHDAAPEGATPLETSLRRGVFSQAFPDLAQSWKAVCGYFGHLYSGRGIEIIQAMAAARPDSLFLVFGGNEPDIKRLRAENALSNLCFMGHLSHAKAQEVMRWMDILLMPYQERVSIGVGGHDTAKWMSPMKMFEYMASGVPIISSDLPVLREILRNGENALMVPSADSEAWVAALGALVNDPDMAARIGSQAHADFQAKHTWDQRAKRIMKEA